MNICKCYIISEGSNKLPQREVNTMNNGYRDYETEKREFFARHSHEAGDVKEYSCMDGFGVMHKNICFADGAGWSEHSEKVTESKKVSIKGIEVTVSIDLFRCEYWNTDSPNSKYFYEAWK